jgi:hypothetical protein
MDIKVKYTGKNSHRYKQNPLELAFAREWQDRCETGANLEYLLSGGSNQRWPVSEQEQMTANTVVQWLGSPIGQSFLAAVMAKKEAEYFLQYLVADPIIREKLLKLLKT